MRFHDITKDDMKNGDGLRVVLWLSGCEHKCPECQNPITWDKNYGLVFDDNAKAELFDALSRDYISGITLSGGDPLFIGNRNEITALLKEIRDKFPDKNVWCYTGYLFEQVKDIEALKYIDVLVDGPYIAALNDNKLWWKGSENQRVIDVKKTLQNLSSEPVLWISK